MSHISDAHIMVHPPAQSKNEARHIYTYSPLALLTYPPFVLTIDEAKIRESMNEKKVDQ